MKLFCTTSCANYILDILLVYSWIGLFYESTFALAPPANQIYTMVLFNHTGKNVPLIIIGYVIVFLLNRVLAAGNFELQILEISNSNNHVLSGYCCGVPLEIRNTKTTGCPPCSTSFRLCLKEYQGSSPLEKGVFTGCSFGNDSTRILGESSFVLSNPEIGSIVLPFSFRWTKSFTLILQAVDMYNTSYPDSERLIEETSFSGVILPSPDWKTLDHIGVNARITYRVRVQCAATYYNTTCTTFCRPRNDQFGHYTCGAEGQKVCMAGWQGANCEIAVCKPGCHGKCDHPGECECRPGWRGPLCDECMVYPGCKHGSCNGSAWQCLCDTNWGGILCDQDLNFCGTHEPCLHGGTCENTAPDQYRCTCADGLSGQRCEIVEHPCATQPCKNGGTCILKEPAENDRAQSGSSVIVRGIRGMSSMGKPMMARKPSTGFLQLTSSSVLISTPTYPPLAEFKCTCAPGWDGPTCEINIDECAGGPCDHGGTCIDLIGGFRCECPPEWIGDVCQMDVDECNSNAASNLGPCVNAHSCHNTPGGFSCSCLDGWGGTICAQDLDDCVGGQCRNGATCIDLINDYHCACAIGYTGRDCETDINECANSPCRNGGECIDLIGNFKCICPLGYSGSLCEEAKDHCTPSPCVHGSCLNTPGGYYCHCPHDKSGKHCELNRTICPNQPCYDGCTPRSNETTLTLTVPCSGHGKCDTTTGIDRSCKCYSGYTGIYCEHNLNECSPNPCRNGGICMDGDDDFTCECIPGWTGKTCTDNVSQCYTGQCLNGGTCTTKNEVAMCRCASGWGGQFCDEQRDQCEGQPCHNGGTCESGSGWFRCSCARGFSGPDCRINVNDCSPQPCLGGATCIDGIGGFSCICPVGRKGERCEISLSDPSSVCSNTSTLSPYRALEKQENMSSRLSEEFCNACICDNGIPKCTKLWCGLPNCFASLKSSNHTANCEIHEVCVPSLRESCLSEPCDPRGDCRSLEPLRRVAPPKLPANSECWPNQITLNGNCARLTILMELSKSAVGTSVESLCLVFRTQLSARLIKTDVIQKGILFLLCDIKNGTNDSIEVAMSSSVVNDPQLPFAVKLMGDLLSRQNTEALNGHATNTLEMSPLVSILEVKVETALVGNDTNGPGLLVGILCGAGIVAFIFGLVLSYLWRQRLPLRSNSGVSLSSPTDILRNEEEKSNNLQNEENLRRYANPLKGSTTSLRGAMELSLNPTPDISNVSQLSAGTSAIHRSQPLYPAACEADFERDMVASARITQHNRRSQILLQKTHNCDMKKNTVGSIESPRKDFGKRSINCKSAAPSIDTDVLTVHV